MTNPIHKPGITLKDIGGEAMLYSAEEQAVHVLNATARIIWDLCDGQHPPAQMEQEIRARFEVPAQINVLGDIEQTLQVLRSKGLLQ